MWAAEAQQQITKSESNASGRRRHVFPGRRRHAHDSRINDQDIGWSAQGRGTLEKRVRIEGIGNCLLRRGTAYLRKGLSTLLGCREGLAPLTALRRGGTVSHRSRKCSTRWHSPDAPVMMSTSSLVMAAWRPRLYLSVSFPIMSPAF